MYAIRSYYALEQERLESLAGELEQAYAAAGNWEMLRERPEA